jgi:hypothetical protein
MNGPAHYSRAEEIAEHAATLIEAGDHSGVAPVWAALAQVHATLASAAAAALGSSAQESRAWADVAGTRLSGRG